MHLPEESSNQGTDQSVLVKKPTRWMTNSTALASMLGVRCSGGHEHSKLEGAKEPFKHQATLLAWCRV